MHQKFARRLVVFHFGLFPLPQLFMQPLRPILLTTATPQPAHCNYMVFLPTLLQLIYGLDVINTLREISEVTDDWGDEMKYFIAHNVYKALSTLGEASGVWDAIITMVKEDSSGGVTSRDYQAITRANRFKLQLISKWSHAQIGTTDQWSAFKSKKVRLNLYRVEMYLLYFQMLSELMKKIYFKLHLYN